jgi:Ca-activated chloride channel family protein
LSAAVRQEVLAISEQLYAEEISALPRRWIEADIPRVDQAPDIQLPVELTEPSKTGAFDAAAVAVYLADPDAGTPEWSSFMGERLSSSPGGISIPPVAPDPSSFTTLDERPEEISDVQAIENLLNIRVTGYEAPAPDGHLYFALHIGGAPGVSMPVQHRDLLFIQDSSESMTPTKIDECRRGLKRWLDFMNPGDRFEIITFSDTTKRAFGHFRVYNQDSRQAAFQFIDGIRALGNTDIYVSLQEALSVDRDPERTLILVLITDGRPTVGVTGSSEIIEGITRFNEGQISMFTVGGGAKVNSFFLDLLSYRNRGEAVIVKGEEEIPRGMERWAGQLRRPVLTDLTYSFSKVDVTDIYPKKLTHLFLDRPLVIHGRLPADADEFVFQVVGRAGTARHDMVFVINRAQIAAGSPELRTQWAWQKAYHLIGDYLGHETEDRLEAIRDFADAYGLVVPYGFSRTIPRRR